MHYQSFILLKCFSKLCTDSSNIKAFIITATYEIQNSSIADITADLVASVTQNTDDTKFAVTPTLTKSSIAPNEKSELTIKVDLIAVSITGENNSTITVQVQAEPVQ